MMGLSMLLYGKEQTIPEFNKQHAWDYLVNQTDIGPRNPGSDGHYIARDYLVSTLKKFSNQVEEQSFTHDSKSAKASFELTNIAARFGPKDGKQIIIGAHWDTRPWADQDPNYSNRSTPIIGANDGASGVAVVLELARIFSQTPPPIGVTLVLFDGEDLGESWDLSEYGVGSKYFAQHLEDPTQYAFAVVLDMIGDASLDLPMEQNSLRIAPQITRKIWAIGDSLGYEAFQPRAGQEIYDDHLMLYQYANIPAVDIIDFAYPDPSNRYWHTIHDTPDKCSPESLQAVGDVMVHLVYGMENNGSN